MAVPCPDPSLPVRRAAVALVREALAWSTKIATRDAAAARALQEGVARLLARCAALSVVVGEDEARRRRVEVEAALSHVRIVIDQARVAGNARAPDEVFVTLIAVDSALRRLNASSDGDTVVVTDQPR